MKKILIKKYKERVNELEYLKNDSLLLEFLSLEEIETIIESYQDTINYIECGEC